MNNENRQLITYITLVVAVLIVLALWAHIDHTTRAAHPEADQAIQSMEIRIAIIERLLSLPPAERHLDNSD